MIDESPSKGSLKAGNFRWNLESGTEPVALLLRPSTLSFLILWLEGRITPTALLLYTIALAMDDTITFLARLLIEMERRDVFVESVLLKCCPVFYWIVPSWLSTSRWATWQRVVLSWSETVDSLALCELVGFLFLSICCSLTNGPIRVALWARLSGFAYITNKPFSEQTTLPYVSPYQVTKTKWSSLATMNFILILRTSPYFCACDLYICR